MTASAVPLDFAELPPPPARLQASVVIPARDEAHGIAAALEALAAQRDLDGSPLEPSRFEITLLCNNCRDQTAAIARDFARNSPQLALHVVEIALHGAQANVGAARRLLMDAACVRLTSLADGRPASATAGHPVSAMDGRPASATDGRPASATDGRMIAATSERFSAATSERPAGAADGEPRAICSTDADTRVSPTWIAAILAEIAAGAEAVGGRILVAGEDSAANSGATQPERAAYLRDTAYRLAAARLENLIDPQSADPIPRHFQFFGASLAITPRAYALVGGLPRVPCLEDVALERALKRADIAVRHSPHVRALTSARQSGRVEIGLSTQLREWREQGAHNREWLVPSAPELCARFGARRALRALHARTSSGQSCDAELHALGAELRLNPRWLAARTRKASAFGALWSDVERALDCRSLFRAQWPPVPVGVALTQLRARLEGVAGK